MEYAQKIFVLPIDHEQNENNEKFMYDMEKSLNIALKLYNIKAFDHKLRLKVNDKFIDNTNIIHYILSLFNQTKNKYEDEFADAIHVVNIDPELVLNNNIREKLLNKLNNKVYTKISPLAIKSNKSRTQWIMP